MLSTRIIRYPKYLLKHIKSTIYSALKQEHTNVHWKREKTKQRGF